ncbi:serine/threonine protein kinase [Murinocardiopsis flavida]|uniref:non-specific serine/threonine protein kinase n=1 Tax=Murinocardiopsis flavida TaxID=645275 RepID=A0A2P8DSL6_9ACTN|nr:protein kinase [Murinocardiopsis flavida]PSL00213.1 serine/threonine protein kinase [Murinocardiopsis flavida]
MERVLGGRYRLGERLGAGGMGEVWSGVDELLDRPVAVKLVRPELVGSDDALDRFHREARMTARLAGHPNIVILYDFGEHEDSVYAVMELVRGRTVAASARGGGPMPIAQAADWVAQTCAGLGAAHAAGIVHRDVKPGNLMSTSAGTVKILDFGIAGFHEAAVQSRRLTRTGELMGTPLYMSPEQIQRAAVGPPSDLYSLGAILYRLLTGEPPFHAEDPFPVLRMHLQDRPESPRALRPEIPAELAGLILQMLAKSPADRPEDAEEVRTRLAPFLPSASGRDRPGGGATAEPDGPSDTPDDEPTHDATRIEPTAGATLHQPGDTARRPASGATETPDGPAHTLDDEPTHDATRIEPTAGGTLHQPRGSAPPPLTPRRAVELRLDAIEADAENGYLATAAQALQDLRADLEEIYGADHPETLKARRKGAYLAGKAGYPAHAAELFAALAADNERVHGRAHPETLAALHYLAVNAGRIGDHARAARVHEHLLPDLATVHGADSERVLTARLHLAHEVGEAGEPARAAQLLESLLPDLARVLGAAHATVLRARHYAAAYTGHGGDPAEAARRYHELLADTVRVHGAGHPETSRARDRLRQWQDRAR